MPDHFAEVGKMVRQESNATGSDSAKGIKWKPLVDADFHGIPSKTLGASGPQAIVISVFAR